MAESEGDVHAGHCGAGTGASRTSGQPKLAPRSLFAGPAAALRRTARLQYYNDDYQHTKDNATKIADYKVTTQLDAVLKALDRWLKHVDGFWEAGYQESAPLEASACGKAMGYANSARDEYTKMVNAGVALNKELDELKHTPFA